MENQKKERLEKMITQGVNSYVSEKGTRSSLIIITRVSLDKHTKRGVVYFTVLPDNYEKQAMIFLNRHASDIQQHLKKTIRKYYLPYLTFEIDKGEKNRQLINKLLRDE